MFDFIILTPTFNRSEHLHKIIMQIKQEIVNINLTVLHCVIDDGSDLNLHNYETLLYNLQTRRYKTKLKRHSENFGRDNFWRTYDELIKMAKEPRWRYAIFIPDDHFLCDQFLQRVSNQFNIIRRKDKIAVAMNLLVQSKKNWRMNRFVDCAFICSRIFFDCLSWTITPVDTKWFRQYRKIRSFKTSPPSSGVGKQISQRMSHHSNYRISRVVNVSYLKAMDCQSVMFPQEVFPNRPNTWGLNNFIDDKVKT